jgi:hypothetical protein
VRVCMLCLVWSGLVWCCIRLLLLYFRAIPAKPPRPRHIPTTSSATSQPAGLSPLHGGGAGAGGGRGAGTVSGEGLSASLLSREDRGGLSSANSSVNSSVDVGGQAAAGGAGAGTGAQRGRGGSAARSLGPPARGGALGAGAGSPAAFDPFKSDGALQLPAEFGARRTSSSSVGSGRRQGQ